MSARTPSSPNCSRARDGTAAAAGGAGIARAARAALSARACLPACLPALRLSEAKIAFLEGIWVSKCKLKIFYVCKKSVYAVQANRKVKGMRKHRGEVCCGRNKRGHGNEWENIQ